MLNLKSRLKREITLKQYFTNNFLQVLINAGKVAIASNRKKIGPRQILIALLITPETAAYNMLAKKANIDVSEYVRGLTHSTLGNLVKKLDEISVREAEKLELSAETREIILEAVRFVNKIKWHYVGTEHLLVALLIWGQLNLDSATKPLLEKIGNLDEFIVKSLSAAKIGKTEPIESPLLELGEKELAGLLKKGVPDSIVNPPEQNIRNYIYDVYAYFQMETLGVLVQREEYITEIFKGLMDPLHKSVMLVGPSGVGKTYLVYLVSALLRNGQVPVALSGSNLVGVSLAKIIQGARFPTDIEKIIMQIIGFFQKYTQDIVFIDNLQYIVNPHIQGGMNIRGSLRHFFESKNTRLITTMPEADFNAMQEGDPEFARLFKVIRVKEPNEEKIMQILNAYASKISTAVPIDFEPGSFSTLINLAGEYLPTGVFPDKAVRLLGDLISEKLYKYQIKYKNIGVLQNKIQEAEHAKTHFVDLGDYAQATRAKEFQKQLKKDLEKISKLMQKESSKTIKITVKDIRDLIARTTGLPIETVSSDESSMLLHLEDRLKEYIVSQDKAIKQVAYAVKRGRLGIASRNRPWASFLFLGPTGVGKTELAKALAKTLFGDDKDHLVQIDMSELMESHSVSKLIGAPPGYVGFRQGGILTNTIKKNPYSVVLFDEIEKAADEVLNILLQILEEGHLTDSRGERVSFANTIIVLTSNIGAEKIFEDRVLGFYRDSASKEDVASAYESVKEELLKELKKKIRPELINRLDDIIIFKTLTKKDGAKILQILLRELNVRLLEIGVQIKLTKKAENYLLKKGVSQEYGARPLKRELQYSVENLLADYLLKNHELYRTLQVSKPKNFIVDYNKAKKGLYISGVK